MHETQVPMVTVDDLAHKIHTYKGGSRLLWTRDKEGNLTTVRTNHPHLDHFLIAIDKASVRSGEVINVWAPTEEPPYELHFYPKRDPISEHVEHIIQKFERHKVHRPIKVRITSAIKGKLRE